MTLKLKLIYKWQFKTYLGTFENSIRNKFFSIKTKLIAKLFHYFYFKNKSKTLIDPFWEAIALNCLNLYVKCYSDFLEHKSRNRLIAFYKFKNKSKKKVNLGGVIS